MLAARVPFFARRFRDLFAVAALAFVVVAMTEPSARAADVPTAVLVLASTAPEACGSTAALRQGVAERLGYNPFRAEAARRLTVNLSGRGPFRAVVSLTSNAGRVLGRQPFEDADCGAIAGAVVLAAVLAIDPLALSPAPREARAPEPLPPAHDAPPTLPAIAATTGPPPRERPSRPSPPGESVHVRVAAGAEVLGGLVPGAAVGANGALGLRRGRWGLDLEGTTTSAGTTTTNAGGVSATATAGTLSPCYELVSSRSFGGALCMPLTAGALFSRGVGGALQYSRVDPLVFAGLRALAEWKAWRAFGLAAYGQAQIPLEHDELSVAIGEATTVVWKTPTASVAGGVVLFASLP